MGALVPLTRPGWVEAGRHLLAGLDLAVRGVNDAGGIDANPLELVVRDTAGDPERAAAAVDELAGLGAVAVAGEYHSVAARAAATRADALGMPFLCSSAVLDALTDEPTEWVARLAPAQSHGWRIYADFLLGAGRRRVAVATQPSVYWTAGTRVLRNHLTARRQAAMSFRPPGRPSKHATRVEETFMTTSVTDEQVRQLAETAKPYSLALLWWGPERHMDGADATEREHQRRMVSLRADGVIAILCPVGSETLAGVAILNLPPDAARDVMDGDPCVRAGMMVCEVHSCHSFPGDALPG